MIGPDPTPRATRAASSETPPGVVPLPVLSGVGRGAARSRHPSWIKVRFSENERFREVRDGLRRHGLHTVCEEAECPNRGECWAHGTATFMLLGDTCTRSCHFCSVGKGRPRPPDAREPEGVAEVAESLALDYVVLTSVTRDDLPDEGAGQFARTAEAITRRRPQCRVESLVPDFHARPELIDVVVRSPHLVFAHNVETVPRLYRRVRPGSDYRRSLRALEEARRLAREAGRGADLFTKSSLMVGLGETREEIRGVFEDLRSVGVDIVTLGQYLQPTSRQAEVFRHVPPAEFDEMRAEALELGFRQAVAGPLVRSSYHAWEAVEGLAPPS